ncbi:uncharacterized protein LOC117642435 [Thrips palmi]|uniref:Uncharacterized protein LOC117642435 n=1 Tax=Thrips palmi TaxID=161013 RepID=A0A6P8ZK65_THRPL|nr:uncharacterized protein LOC117642435 [Thrips palmi]
MSKQDGGLEGYEEKRPSSPPPSYEDTQLHQFPPQHGDGVPKPQHPGGQSPAPITNITVNAPAPAAQPIIVNNVVGVGGAVVCAKCGSNIVIVKEESTCMTHCCCLLCCFTIPFCFFLPYCCNWCKKPVQRCGGCRSKIA